MKLRLTSALTVTLLLSGTGGFQTPGLAAEKRDQIISEYYRHNPRDSDYDRWRKNHKSWSDEDYIEWYRTRTLQFQVLPGVAAAFGVDPNSNSVPGFQAY